MAQSSCSSEPAQGEPQRAKPPNFQGGAGPDLRREGVDPRALRRAANLVSPRADRRIPRLVVAGVAVVGLAFVVVIALPELRTGVERVVALARSALGSDREQLATPTPRSPDAPSTTEPARPAATAEAPRTSQLPPTIAQPSLDAPHEPAERSALARLLAASGVAQVARAPEGTRASGGPPREVAIGAHRYAVTIFHDAAGRPSGVLVAGGGGTAAMQAAFDELATWSSAQFGAGREVRELARTEPWARATRWATPEADVELRGWCNSARDSRVLAVDLRKGSIRAAYEAQVELLYSTRGR